MKSSNIGGQAVLEGIMMKNQDRYAVAVRKPDHQIDVKVENYKSTIKNEKIRHLPIVRGVVNFVESLVLGMSTLMYSASFFEDEEEDNKKKNLSEEERKKLEEKEKKQEKQKTRKQKSKKEKQQPTQEDALDMDELLRKKEERNW